MRRSPFRPTVPALEPRTLLSAAPPSALEQAFLERLDDARAALGGTPTETMPLAVSPQADAVAESLRLPSNGKAINVQAVKNALRADGVGFDNRFSIVVQLESGPLDSGGSFADDVAPQVAQLLRGFADRKRAYGFHQYVGVAITPDAQDPSTGTIAVVTFEPKNNAPVLTGTVFSDQNGDGAYEPGEGLGGVTVAVSGGPSTQTFPSGGFTLPLKQPGTYTVTASGGGLSAPLSQVVTVAKGTNARVQFVQSPPALGTHYTIGTLAVSKVNLAVLPDAIGDDANAAAVAIARTDLEGAELDFLPDGTFAIKPPAGAGSVLVSGTYIRSGSTISLSADDFSTADLSSEEVRFSGQLTLPTQGSPAPLLSFEFGDNYTNGGVVQDYHNIDVVASAPVT